MGSWTFCITGHRSNKCIQSSGSVGGWLCHSAQFNGRVARDLCEGFPLVLGHDWGSLAADVDCLRLWARDLTIGLPLQFGKLCKQFFAYGRLHFLLRRRWHPDSLSALARVTWADWHACSAAQGTQAHQSSTIDNACNSILHFFGLRFWRFPDAVMRGQQTAGLTRRPERHSCLPAAKRGESNESHHPVC